MFFFVGSYVIMSNYYRNLFTGDVVDEAYVRCHRYFFDISAMSLCDNM